MDHQQHAGRGEKVIDRLAGDLRDAAAAWPTEADFLQSPSPDSTGSHVTTLVTRLDDQELRTW